MEEKTRSIPRATPAQRFSACAPSMAGDQERTAHCSTVVYTRTRVPVAIANKIGKIEKEKEEEKKKEKTNSGRGHFTHEPRHSLSEEKRKAAGALAEQLVPWPLGSVVAVLPCIEFLSFFFVFWATSVHTYR